MGDNRGELGRTPVTARLPDPDQGGVGFIPIDSVIGKAFVIVWPTDRWGGV